MTGSKSHLRPTVITDKNGKVTTTYRKDTAPASKRDMPAPQMKTSTKGRKPSTASRMRGINEIFGEVNKQRTRHWLVFSKPDQLAELDKVLDGFKDMGMQEKRAVITALTPLRAQSYSTKTIHAALKLRGAFCSKWSKQNYPSTSSIHSLIYGVNDDYSVPALTNEQEVKEVSAVLRFAYDVRARVPYGDVQPVFEVMMGRDMDDMALQYDNPSLVALLRENPDRVDELIKHTMEHETCDPHFLRSMIEHEGPTSLASGHL